MKYILVLIIILIMIISFYISVHDKEIHLLNETVKDSSKQKADTAMMNHKIKILNHEKSEENNPFKINYLEQTFSLVHNKLVHFPIALSMLGFLFTVLNFKWKQFEFSIRFIVLTASIFAIPVIFTGLFQADNFVGGTKEWLVNTHKIIGILSLSILWIWTFF